MLTSPLKKLVLVLTTACLLQGCVAAAIGGAAVAVRQKLPPILAPWERKLTMKR